MKRSGPPSRESDEARKRRERQKYFAKKAAIRKNESRSIARSARKGPKK